MCAFAGSAHADLPGPRDPLAGYAGDQPFLRAADNSFVVFPGAQLQIDQYVYPYDTDRDYALLFRNARLELSGWIGSHLYFDVMVDFARLDDAEGGAPRRMLRGTDDYIAYVPGEGDTFILQIGQFDAPYTFENRTRDSYLDFMMRSIAVRSLGMPTGRAVGGMVHGALAKPLFTYEAAALNAHDEEFDDLGDHLDIVGRVTVHPMVAIDFARLLVAPSIGLSVWGGLRGNDGPLVREQTTGGGVPFFRPRWRLPSGSLGGLRESDAFFANAFHVSIPIAHKLGVRGELLLKDQKLTEVNLDLPGSAPLGTATLSGGAGYLQAWWWIVGNDRILPEAGYQYPIRLTAVRSDPPKHGVLAAFRWDHVHETFDKENDRMQNPVRGETDVDALQAGATYWYSRRFRAGMEGTLHWLRGTSPSIARAQSDAGGSSREFEIGVRVGASL
jgi:hypothetical protein